MWITCSGSWDTSPTTELESLENFWSCVIWYLEILLSLTTKKRLQTWWKSIHFNLNKSSFLNDDQSFLTNLTRLFSLIISYLSSFCWYCRYVDQSCRYLIAQQNWTNLSVTLIQFLRNLKSSSNLRYLLSSFSNFLRSLTVSLR